MAGKTFIDTNILVYSADHHDPAKQKRSRDLLKAIEREGGGVISTQVIQEFYVAATRKLQIAPVIVKGMIEAFNNLEVVVVDIGVIEHAIDCSILHQLSFWDSLIVVSAEKARCARVWTEDMNNGQTVHGVRIENPLNN
jgi:predicted nucleic acid-binding protein